MNTAQPLNLRPPAAILGVPFDQVTMAEALQRIQEMISSGKPHYAATPNADFLVQAREDVELRRILCEADLVVCDGTPVLWSSKLLGVPLPERVAGSDMVPLLLKLAEERSYRVFFLGASPEAGQQAAARLARDYPALQLAGIYSPPFRPLLEMDHEDIRQRISAAKPDILLVCFGCPKQEKWIAMHYQDLGVPISMGVGGTLDFLAGRLRRAPLWMRHAGLEWLFRLAQEPRRLFRRYVKDLAVFGWAVLEQLAVKHSPARRFNETPASSANSHFALPTTFNRDSASNVFAEALARLSDDESLTLDFGNVRQMDGVGVGALLRLQAISRKNRRHLILSRVPKHVLRLLKAHRVAEFFTLSAPAAPAQDLLASERIAPSPVRFRREAERCVLAWHGEVTAATAKSFWESSWAHLSAQQPSRCAVDLSGVSFMDSSGLSVLVRLRKAATENGSSTWLTRPSKQVSNALRVARMESFLTPPSLPAKPGQASIAQPAHALP